VIRRVGFGLLAFIMTLAMLQGAYLAYQRYRLETQNKGVELVIDFNDIKKIAAYEKTPLPKILDALKTSGVTGIGLFEETLPDAGALGELYYAGGSGILRLKNVNAAFKPLIKQRKIKTDRTYIYLPNSQVRQRIAKQLKWILGERSVNFLTKEILEVHESEEELRDLGLGFSEAQENFIRRRGFQVVPRVWNDARYHLGNIDQKVSGYKGHHLIIFDGEEVLGYPDTLPELAKALKKYQIDYGYVEIVKQDGDRQLKKLMGTGAVKVHSVPKDELKKLTREEALDRFVRAVRERNVRVIYLRPFLPPQIDAFPVQFNLKYFRDIKTRLAGAGFELGSLPPEPELQVTEKQLWLLALGVLIGTIFLLNQFVKLPTILNYIILLLVWLLTIGLGSAGFWLPVQKALAFLAALVFPAYALIATFGKAAQVSKIVWRDAMWLLINCLAETAIGVFLLLGLLADSRFLSGIETFPAVKMALILPIFIVALYFVAQGSRGTFRQRIWNYLQTKVSLLAVLGGLTALGGIALLAARSGNFLIPVPSAEKTFRSWLELILFVRPRTKEFLIGYPALLLLAAYYLRGGKKWLWLLAAIGVIAPVSVFNSFSHIHTPLYISLVRTLNGLLIGIILGYLAILVAYWLRLYNKGEPAE